MMGLMLYGIYPDYDNHPLSRTAHILYQASHRFIWSIGLGYIIFACLNSQGGIFFFEKTILTMRSLRKVEKYKQDFLSEF